MHLLLLLLVLCFAVFSKTKHDQPQKTVVVVVQVVVSGETRVLIHSLSVVVGTCFVWFVEVVVVTGAITRFVLRRFVRGPSNTST